MKIRFFSLAKISVALFLISSCASGSLLTEEQKSEFLKGAKSIYLEINAIHDGKVEVWKNKEYWNLARDILIKILGSEKYKINYYSDKCDIKIIVNYKVKLICRDYQKVDDPFWFEKLCLGARLKCSVSAWVKDKKFHDESYKFYEPPPERAELGRRIDYTGLWRLSGVESILYEIASDIKKFG